MTAQKLSQAAAFSAGSQLWVFADPRASAFARQIDFYLNFQIARAQHAKVSPMPKKLLDIVKDHQMEEVLQKPPISSHWLISTQRELPCQQLVVVPYSSPEQWVLEGLMVWKRLDRPSFRLFLPQPAANLDIAPLLPKEFDHTVTYVPGDLQLDA